MKKIESIIKQLEKLKETAKYHFDVWDMQNMLDLAKSCVKGDISHKIARQMIYEECTGHLDSGCYDSAHASISLKCLPIIWK